MKNLICYIPLFMILIFNIISGLYNEFYVGVVLNILLLILIIILFYNKFLK